MNSFINRIEPQMGAHAYKTYQLTAPPRTHRRMAACVEVQCDAHIHGWRMGFDVSDPEKAAAVKWITQHSGRHFIKEEVGTKVILTFPAGQNCFVQHTTMLDREPFYVVREGDWRGNPRAVEPRVLREDDWVDDFANHQDKLATRLAQG